MARRPGGALGSKQKKKRVGSKGKVVRGEGGGVGRGRGGKFREAEGGREGRERG